MSEPVALLGVPMVSQATSPQSTAARVHWITRFACQADPGQCVAPGGSLVAGHCSEHDDSAHPAGTNLRCTGAERHWDGGRSGGAGTRHAGGRADLPGTIAEQAGRAVAHADGW